jgi:hypothetical protein
LRVEVKGRLARGRGSLALGLAALVAGAALDVVVEARAGAAAPVDRTWSAPAGCPSGQDVRGEIDRLARMPPGRTAAPLSVDARVEPRGARWLLHLRTLREGLEGERELDADSCASLAHAAALVVALAAAGLFIQRRAPFAVTGLSSVLPRSFALVQEGVVRSRLARLERAIEAREATRAAAAAAFKS